MIALPPALLIGLIVGAGLMAERAQAAPRPAYEGVWATNVTACRAPDGVDRMLIEGSRFAWYETRCRAKRVRRLSARAWAAELSCRGEGTRVEAMPRLSLPDADRLAMVDGPVGSARTQVYIRCIDRH